MDHLNILNTAVTLDQIHLHFMEKFSFSLRMEYVSPRNLRTVSPSQEPEVSMAITSSSRRFTFLIFQPARSAEDFHNAPSRNYKKYNQSFPYPAPPLPAAQKTDGETFCNRTFRILPFLPLPSGPLSDFPAVSGDPDGLRQYRKEACSIFPLFFFLFLLCRCPTGCGHQNERLPIMSSR